MPSLDELEPRQREALVALTARLKHDLGKYVAFQARWLAPDADAAARVAALRDDLLATRRGPDGTVDAVEVWAPYARSLLGQDPLVDGVILDMSDDPDVRRIVASMVDVESAIGGLRAGELDEERVDAALAAAAGVAEACRTLHRRAREASAQDG